MTVWFFILGLPLLFAGAVALAAPAAAAAFLRAFPRNVLAGRALCAVAWGWTAYECHVIGIDIFDTILKAFPHELLILAVVLTILTCWWMPNLLPIRAACGLLMLFPGEMFPVIRLCDTPWRLTLVVFAYLCALTGMFGMFYPWRLRQFAAFVADARWRVAAGGVLLAATGALFTALGALAASGALS